MSDELLEQFLIEGRDLVQQAGDDLIALESTGADSARIDSLFRAVHTLKGSTGLFDIAPMGRLLHAVEDLLETVRRSGGPLEKETVGRLFECVGLCEAWFEHIGRVGGLPEAAEADSRRLVAAFAGVTVQSFVKPAPDDLPGWAARLMDDERKLLARSGDTGDAVVALRHVPAPSSFFRGDDPLMPLRAIPGLLTLRLTTRDASSQGPLNPFTCRLVVEALTTASLDEVKSVYRLVADEIEVVRLPPVGGAPKAIVARGAPQTSLRVAATAVDALIAATGELMIAKNRLAHLVQALTIEDRAASDTLNLARASLERIAADVQGRALGLRLLPLRETFRRLPRLVRDTASALGKTIAFTTHGESIEIDKAIADAMFEPLLHLLRNAIDHGIEDETARRSAGKPAQGGLGVWAERQGSMVAVSVVDDGGGIDPRRIRESAVARGVLSAEAAADLDPSGVLDLLFAPGFSTADEVTTVSGRGVGLDAVRASLALLGGSVSVESRVGQGSTFRLLLPQMAASATVLVVRAGADRFGLAVDAIVEVVRCPVTAVSAVRHGEAFVHRGRTLPLVRLVALVDAGAPARAAREIRVVVVEVAGERIGLEIDDVEDQVELLLRPPEGLIAASAAIVGTALLGDGSVLLVLDIAELLS